jgi:hypothetical protein
VLNLFSFGSAYRGVEGDPPGRGAKLRRVLAPRRPALVVETMHRDRADVRILRRATGRML